MTLDTVLSQALKRIKPTGAGVLSKVRITIAAINACLTKQKIKAQAVLGGSFAKGTHLADDFDVDIFVRFDRRLYEGKDISRLLAGAIKPFKPTRMRGSRDYFQFCRGKIQYEIVPVLAVSFADQAVNVTDCSPLHVAWVSTHIKKLHDDIRLAKQFFKAAEVYGAESYIRGFSGHVIDLLVIIHKGFIPLLTAISHWKAPVVIDVPKKHKGKALSRLNPSKTQSPLIIIDPVQPDRNASASLSHEKFHRTITAARNFLQHPSIEGFEIRELAIDNIKMKGPTITVTAWPVSGKRDVAGSKLLQAHELIAKELSLFGVAESGWQWRPGKHSLHYFVLKMIQLAPTMTIQGPPASLTIHAEAFKRKHPSAQQVKNRLVAEEPRLEQTPQQVLKRVCASEYITSRVKRISISGPIPRS